MSILKLKAISSRYKKILFGQDVYFPIQHHCEKTYYGNHTNGWSINPSILNKESVIYSLGIGNDIRFDLALIEKYGCEVHGFDPTPITLEWLKKQKIPSQFHIHPVAISDKDGEVTFYPPEESYGWSSSMVQKDGTIDKSYQVPAKRISTLMKELGHSHIDLLKMDIEGAEYPVVTDFLKEGIRPTQVLIEIHHRFQHLSLDHTKNMVKELNDAGYKIFSISPFGQEYSFIKVD